MKFPRRDVRLARHWQLQLAIKAQASDHQARRLFLDDFGKGGVVLGRAETPTGWTWVRTDRVLQGHALITGSTGSGKSRLIAAVIYQLLKSGIPLVLTDLKGELAGIVKNTIVPALIQSGAKVGPIRIVDPFDPHRTPLLRFSEPDGSSREVQALNLASALGEAVGEDLKTRMHRAFLRFSSLAIEKNLPLPIIAEWASSPQRFLRDARSSSDPQVKHYATSEFPREPRATLDALRARLDELFHLREVRLALSAPTCLSFSEILDSGVTIFDLGSPPAGAESAVRFIGGPIVGRLSRAILSRKPGTPCLVIYEEVQELLGTHQIALFKRCAALARFKLCFLWFSTQGVAQLDDVDPMLRRIIRTNAGLEMIFRSSIEDAAKLSQGLSIRGPRESISAARQRFIEEVASLPRREFYLWVKDALYGPQRIRSPKMDLDELDALARTLSAEDRLAIQHGVVSIPADQVRESVPEEVEEPPIKKKSRLG